MVESAQEIQEPQPPPVADQQEAGSPPLTMKSLLEAGVHFGHPTRRWHPRMRSYIFTQRNGIHIIDLQKTLQLLERYCEMVKETVATQQ